MKDEGLKQSDREDAVPSEGTRTAVPLSPRGSLRVGGAVLLFPHGHASWSESFIMELPQNLGMDRRERQVLLAVL